MLFYNKYSITKKKRIVNMRFHFSYLLRVFYVKKYIKRISISKIIPFVVKKRHPDNGVALHLKSFCLVIGENGDGGKEYHVFSLRRVRFGKHERFFRDDTASFFHKRFQAFQGRARRNYVVDNAYFFTR